MKRASCCRSVLLFVCLAAVALGVGAQSALDPRDPASYFAAMPVQNDAERVHELLAEMHSVCKVADDACEPGARLLEVLFQGSYRDELPDFIVELYRDPATGHLDVRQPQLIFDRKSTPLLSGAEHLYVLVFSPVRVAMRARLTTQSVVRLLRRLRCSR
jgi:hypothetical protein